MELMASAVLPMFNKPSKPSKSIDLIIDLLYNTLEFLIQVYKARVIEDGNED